MFSPVIFSKRFFLFTAVFGLVYFCLNIYALNYRLVYQTLWGNYPTVYKLNILSVLLDGARSSLSEINLITLILVSILTGANLYMLIKRIVYLHKIRKLTAEVKQESEVQSRWGILAAIGSFLGFVGSGCASCSLPILAYLGLSGSLAYLPFKGAEIPIVALAFLAISFVILIRSHLTESACRV